MMRLRRGLRQRPSLGLLPLLLLVVMTMVSMSKEEAGQSEEKEAGTGLVGDIDRSSAVDEKDRMLMEKSIGANPDDPDWDERCDLDGDKFISFKDLSILRDNMGKRMIGGEIVSDVSYYSYGLPRLFWAPSTQMGELSGDGPCEGKVMLRLRVDEYGSAVSAKPVLSDASPAETRILVALSRVWHFEPAQDASGAPVASYCIVTMDWNDLCAVPGGHLPE